MFPSDRPVVRSMSSGVSTWRWRMTSRMFGANSAIRSMTASPNASRLSSQLPDPGARGYGAYWTQQLMTCLPGGAIDGATSVGTIMPEDGVRPQGPDFAAWE